jgi:hypothetical protein
VLPLCVIEFPGFKVPRSVLKPIDNPLKVRDRKKRTNPIPFR